MTKATKPATSAAKIERAKAFAYAYIRNMGNGTAAAREVFGLQGNSASQRASDMLRNVHVQKLVGEFLDAQRESLKKFTEQGNYYLTIVAQKLIEIITKPDTSTEHCFQAMEKLLRLGGFEISEQVTVAKIQAKAVERGRALLPGLPGPGGQPGASTHNTLDNRKVIFMLSPPSMPVGGVPPPALEEQWRSLGWKPGVATPPSAENNQGNANVPRSGPGSPGRK